MKITKRQLRRLIKEEKAKFLKESVADMTEFQAVIEKVASDISDRFGADMMKLYAEEPDAFATEQPDGTMGRVPEDVWEQQVVYAQQEMDTGIISAIESKISEIENMLHDGQYHDDRNY
jgi:5-methylthioribose kinase